MIQEFDAVVIGGGPGGYVCAEQLAKYGLSTALIDRGLIEIRIAERHGRQAVDRSETFHELSAQRFHGQIRKVLRQIHDPRADRFHALARQLARGHVEIEGQKRHVHVHQQGAVMITVPLAAVDTPTSEEMRISSSSS